MHTNNPANTVQVFQYITGASIFVYTRCIDLLLGDTYRRTVVLSTLERVSRKNFPFIKLEILYLKIKKNVS